METSKKDKQFALSATSSEEALKRSLDLKIKELQSTAKEFEALSYSISHDLRAPLRIINSYAEVIIADYVSKMDDEGKRLLEVIMKNAVKAGHLIDDVVNFARVGGKELVTEKVNMQELVKSVIDEQLIGREKKYEFETAELKNADGDAMLLQQVWASLISNAIKFSAKREHPLIKIYSWQNNNEIIYCIKDNGVGFDMKHAGKLFGLFQRLHKVTEFEGDGAGLALVRRIITRHGGRVWMEAAVNKGAAFYFSIPLSEKQLE